MEVSATRVERAAWSCGAKRLHASHHGAWNSSRSQLHQQREGRWVLAAAARAPLWSRWEQRVGVQRRRVLANVESLCGSVRVYVERRVGAGAARAAGAGGCVGQVSQQRDASICRPAPSISLVTFVSSSEPTPSHFSLSLLFFSHLSRSTYESRVCAVRSVGAQVAEHASTNAQSASSAREHSGSGRLRRGAIRRLKNMYIFIGLDTNR